MEVGQGRVQRVELVGCRRCEVGVGVGAECFDGLGERALHGAKSRRGLCQLTAELLVLLACGGHFAEYTARDGVGGLLLLFLGECVQPLVEQPQIAVQTGDQRGELGEPAVEQGESALPGGFPRGRADVACLLLPGTPARRADSPPAVRRDPRLLVTGHRDAGQHRSDHSFRDVLVRHGVQQAGQRVTAGPGRPRQQDRVPALGVDEGAVRSDPGVQQSRSEQCGFDARPRVVRDLGMEVDQTPQRRAGHPGSVPASDQGIRWRWVGFFRDLLSLRRNVFVFAGQLGQLGIHVAALFLQPGTSVVHVLCNQCTQPKGFLVPEPLRGFNKPGDLLVGE